MHDAIVRLLSFGTSRIHTHVSLTTAKKARPVFPMRGLAALALQFERALARSDTFLNSGAAFCGSHWESRSIVSR